MKTNRFVLAGLVAVLLAMVAAFGAPSSRAEPLGAKLTWDLASDFQLSPNEANPNPDRYGNAETWSFMRTTAAHDPTTYALLTQFYPNAGENEGLQGWEGPEPTGYPNSGAPEFSMNTRDTPIVFDPNWILPAHVAMTHPDSTQPAVLGWHSPDRGTIAITGGVTDVCKMYGDGIQWFIDKNASTVASGAYANGGAQLFKDGVNGAALGEVQVLKGEMIYFLVAPGGDYYCDGTQLDVTIQAKVCAKAPNGLTPTAGATVSDPEVLLQWNAVGCAGIYHLRITQVSNGKVVVNKKGLTDPSYAFKATAGHRYDWQVRACNMGTCGQWSTPQRLFVQK